MLIDETPLIERILRYLRLPTEVPVLCPGRAQPFFAPWSFEGGAGVSDLLPRHRPVHPGADSPEVAGPTSGSFSAWTSCLIRRSKRR